MDDRVIVITQERPDTDEAKALIDELETYVAPLYPPSSQHGLSVEELIAEKVVFFVLRCDGVAAGCGGIKCYGQEYAEVKRMYVRPAFRGYGLGKRLLNHIEAYTCQVGINVLRLETGVSQPEAISLYERMGYRSRAPFGEYEEDALSVFYEKNLAEIPEQARRS